MIDLLELEYVELELGRSGAGWIACYPELSVDVSKNAGHGSVFTCGAANTSKYTSIVVSGCMLHI